MHKSSSVANVYAASWLGIRASWTHTHAWVSAFPRHISDTTHSSALPLLDIAGMLCLCRGPHASIVISRNIVVNPQWYELTCIAHSAQVLLMCTQRLGWGIRASWTHTHAWVSAFPRHISDTTHSSALPLLDIAGMLCLCHGPHASIVISRNIVVNPQWYELTCIAHSAHVDKCC